MSVASRPLHGLALCAGVGGLELGIGLACDWLGVGYRMVGAVERDAYAAACLVARMGDETLDQAPVWDDLTTFDGAAWRGRVDLVSAGFPCQPFSSAGQRRGTDDERWLWPDIERVVRDVAPRFVFLENVPGLASRSGGLGEVLGGLAGLGFDAEWECLSAADLGAPHRRRRFWCLAYTSGVRLDVFGDPGAVRGAGSQVEGTVRQWERGGNEVGDGSPDVVDADSGRRAAGFGSDQGSFSGPIIERAGDGLADPVCERLQGGLPGAPWREGPARCRPELADAEGSGRERRRMATRPDGSGLAESSRVGAWPPRPDDHPGWERWIAEAGPEPAVRRDADGLASRLDRLHTIGNGVVPVVAAAAFVRLACRAGLVGRGVR